MKKDRSRDLHRKGTEYLHKGDVQRALPLLEKAYRIYPEELDVGINLSSAYILSYRFKLAIQVLIPLSELYPQNAKVWINLGAAYLGNPVLAKDEDQQKAISAFKTSLANDPVSPSVAYNIGLIYRDRKEYNEALGWFKKAIRDNPSDHDARKLLDRMRKAQRRA